MPSGAYAPVRNPRHDEDADDELRAAFDESDDEHDESRPLNPARRKSTDSNDGSDDEHDAAPLAAAPAAPGASRPALASASLPGTYDFENTAYDFPPPGSPPPATRAFANDWGNSNGVLPSPSAAVPREPRRTGWVGRAAAAVLPERVSQRLGLAPRRPAGAIGGGTQNDGVFANVTAKPVRGVRVQDGDESYIVPETTQVERPPSYAAAQADAAPTYWEATSVYAPSGGSSVPGEVIVEGLPTGTLFSFLWNALISVSFQFVGFLLTYLLHTTHAARCGARAGLGVTLIQYGFAMRRSDQNSEGGGGTETVFEPRPTFATAKEAEDWYATHNVTSSADAFAADDDTGASLETTSEWLAFFLMTIGWFILLTSILGYWRVKRWERSILSTSDSSAAPQAEPEGGNRLRHLERLFTIPGLAGVRGGSLLRTGLGLDRRNREAQDDLYFHVLDLETGPQRDEDERTTRPGHTQFVIDENNPDDADRAARALVAEQRLNHDLRAAGLL